MQLVCSYCRSPMGEREPYEDQRISHGMCPGCSAHFTRLWRGVSLNEYLDGFDAPVLVVDGERRVLAANRLMEGLYGRQTSKLRGLLAGEASECVHARRPGGCGGTVHCHTCAIRKAVTTVRDTGEPVERVPARLERDDVKLELLISAYPAEACIQLVIDEVVAAERPSRLRVEGMASA